MYVCVHVYAYIWVYVRMYMRMYIPMPEIDVCVCMQVLKCVDVSDRYTQMLTHLSNINQVFNFNQYFHRQRKKGIPCVIHCFFMHKTVSANKGGGEKKTRVCRKTERQRANWNGSYRNRVFSFIRPQDWRYALSWFFLGFQLTKQKKPKRNMW